MLFSVAMIATAVVVRRERRAGRPVELFNVLWGTLLFYCIGIGFVFFGALHAYFGPFVAPTIGWQPSPFEYELGWLEIPVGIVACMAWWRGFEFRLAATLISVTFAFAAAAQHIQEIACCKNYAPNNAGPTLWFGDLALPIFLLAVAFLARRPTVR
jgi:hypothetical protein